jgi:hypothetical protein
MKYQTAVILIILAISVVSMNSVCTGCNRDLFGPQSLVKLNATLNDTRATIHRADTLKFKLTIPDIITTLAIPDIPGGSTATSTTQIVAVNSLQRASYAFRFYQVDTLNKRVNLILNSPILSVTDGGLLNDFQVHISHNSKPYTATLNFVSAAEGLFYIEIIPDEVMRVNDSFYTRLIVNFEVTDKHLEIVDPYFPGFSNASFTDSIGYGRYAFRVD